MSTMKKTGEFIAFGVAFALAAPGCLGAATTTGGGGGGGGGSTTTTPTQTAVNSACGKDYSPGHYALRRLTNTEYSNTVQDLLYTQMAPGATFEATSPGPSGFSNDSSALTISSPLFLQYYNAAEALATELIGTKGTAGGAYSKIVTCTTTDSTCASTTVTALAKRAFRRPATSAELDSSNGLMGVFNQSGATSFDQGLSDVIVSLLLNPNFLMLPIVNAKSTDASAVFALDSYQLAARISYDLWQTMPDDTLLAAADTGTLIDPATLGQQVTRLLADKTRTAFLKNTLRDEYAGLAPLAMTDFTTEGETNTLRDAMIGETDAFFTDIISNDRSPLTILNSNQSFVNQYLANFYGVPFPSGADPATFVPVAAGRVGLGSQASVLTNTAGGESTETNPIKRGHWIVDQLYCTPPPPAPTSVPQTEVVETAGMTIKQELAAHAAGSCAGCHVLMDSFGLGAEGFDPFGRTRTKYADGSMVDSSGSFPNNGPSWTTGAQMYMDMSMQPKAQACVAQQLLSYAVSRNTSTTTTNSNSTADSCVAASLATQSVTSSSTFSQLMTGIMTSKQFMYQTGEAQ